MDSILVFCLICFLCNGNGVLFPGSKATGTWGLTNLPPNVEFGKKVELYLHSLNSYCHSTGANTYFTLFKKKKFETYP